MLKAYRRGGKDGGTDTDPVKSPPDPNAADRRGGNADGTSYTSPLDIPGRTVRWVFVVSLLAALIIGTLAMWLLMGWIWWIDLPGIEKKNIAEGFPGQAKNQNERALSITGYLLPHWKQDILNADTAMLKGLTEGFLVPERTDSAMALTVATLSHFLEGTQWVAKGDQPGKDTAIDTPHLKHHIIGDLGWIPNLTPVPADKLADELGLWPSLSEEAGQRDNHTWRRFIFMSAVQSLRDQLDGGLTKPRRLMLALGGTIQWLTFISAVWCLVLLGLLRLPWIKLQTRLVSGKGLPITLQGAAIWEMSNNEFARIDGGGIDGLRSFKGDYIAKRELKGLFIAPRLIKECDRLSTDTSSSIEQLVRERTAAYRDSVDLGEYEMINFLMWAAPTFGFIGTIFGIIGAMESAASIFSAATPVEQGIALDKVSSSLGTAFDTTFVALILLLPMTFLLARVRKQEANFFEELEQKAVSELPGQLRVE